MSIEATYMVDAGERSAIIGDNPVTVRNKFESYVTVEQYKEYFIYIWCMYQFLTDWLTLWMHTVVFVVAISTTADC